MRGTSASLAAELRPARRCWTLVLEGVHNAHRAWRAKGALQLYDLTMHSDGQPRRSGAGVVPIYKRQEAA